MSPTERELYSGKETAAMQYIRMKGTYPGIYRAPLTYDLWKHFESAAASGEANINARVAKDMDRLENLIQLQVYRHKLTESAYEKFRKDLLPTFATRMVQNLAKEFDIWCSNQPPGPRKKFSHFHLPTRRA
jgi:5'-deoxynucleotidase YfbR-like HD superfamily hydrolase